MDTNQPPMNQLPSSVTILFNVLGGLVIFLYAMRLLSGHLQNIVGDKYVKLFLPFLTIIQKGRCFYFIVKLRGKKRPPACMMMFNN